MPHIEEVVNVLFQNQGFPSPMTPGQGALRTNGGRNRLEISQLPPMHPPAPNYKEPPL